MMAPAPPTRATSDSGSSSVRQSRTALVVLCLVLVFGAVGRLSGLGDEDLWIDEFYHVFSAQSLERGDGPRLPSGELYTRGIDISRLVRVSQRYVADPEAAARLPSAVFGILGLVLFAAIAWRLAGAWSAVWSVLLLATFPVALQESRNTRFYTEQLLYGLLAMYAGWRALERTGLGQEESPRDAPAPSSRWAWVTLALVSFLLATRIQPTTLSVVAGWGTVVAVFAAADVRRIGAGALRHSVPLQLTVLGIAALIAVLLVRPSLYRTLLGAATEVPAWARGEFSPKAYYWMLAEAVPLVLSLMPVIFLAVAKRNGALATYLFAWFAVPLALHSFVFRFQADRYVLLALPALFLSAGIAAADACGALHGAVAEAVQRVRAPSSPLAARYAAAGAVALTGLTAIVTTPAFVRARKVMAGEVQVHAGTDWRRALKVLQAIPGADTLPWGASHPLAPKFYWGRVDFAIAYGLLERPVGGPDSAGPRAIRAHPQGSRDFYVGVPVLSTVAALRDHFGPGRDVILAVDTSVEAKASFSDFARELRRKGAAQELCAGRCGSIRMYRWTLPREPVRVE